jgi:flagellar biogenesis protein FliO
MLTAFLFLYAVPSYPQQGGNQNTQNSTVNNTQNNVQAEEKVPGQGFEDQDFGPQVEEESVIWMIFKTLIVLGLFVGGFYMFYKFVTQKAGLQVSGHEAIKILSMVPVGPNRTLQLIDVAGKVYLLGISESGISMLTEIKDKEEIDRIRLLSSRSTPVKDLTFQDFIADQVGWVVDRFNDVKGKISDRKGHGSKVTVQEISAKEFDMSYLDKQKKRLKTINNEDEE